MDRPRSSVPLLAALVAPVVVCAVLVPFRALLTATNAALLLVLVVVAVAATGRRAAGVLAAATSTLAFDFFLTQPYLSLAISARGDIETAVLLVLIGLAVTEVALWGRRQQARASRRQGHLDGLVTAARLAATGEQPAGVVVDLVAGQIRDVLDLDECRFEAGAPSRPGRPRLRPDGAVEYRARTLDVGRDGLPTMDETELDVRSAGHSHGRYLLVASGAVRRPEPEQLLVAVTLAEQAAAALGDGSRAVG